MASVALSYDDLGLSESEIRNELANQGDASKPAKDDVDRAFQKVFQAYYRHGWQKALLATKFDTSSFADLDITSALINTFGPSVWRYTRRYSRLMAFVGSLLTFYATYSQFARQLINFWNWLLSRMFPHVNISPYDNTLKRNVLRFVASRMVIDSAKKYDVASSDFARNQHSGSMKDADKVHFTANSTWEIFRHGMRFFLLTKENGGGLKIWSFSWSRQPLNNMVADANTEGEEEVTVVVDEQLSLKAVKIFAPRCEREGKKLIWKWQYLTKTFPRTMDSVVLPSELKKELIRDLKKFREPGRAHQYAMWSMPYRRNYLLFGPPGTGKTSFAIAIATTYNLRIFQVSLLEPYMNDAVLAELFRKLGKGVMVLLEDIDSAGIGRELEIEKSTESKSTKNKSSSSPHIGSGLSEMSDKAVKLDRSTKAGTTSSRTTTESSQSSLRNVKQKKVKKPAKTTIRSGVTLSGFLNAIDGAASARGQIVVMTTNHKERLGQAFTRRGRVDRDILFDYADEE